LAFTVFFQYPAKLQPNTFLKDVHTLRRGMLLGDVLT
jgi:hypothetical protein